MIIAPGMIAVAISARRQFSETRITSAIASRTTEIAGDTIAICMQSGRRVDVPGEPRQDAAGLHVPQARQRQMHQPREERFAQRQHHADVEQALPVVPGGVKHVRQEDDDEKRRPGEVQAGQALRPADRVVQEDAIDDVPHEQRLDHLEAGDDQGDRQDEGDGRPMRRQPAEVLAQVLAPFRRRRRPGSFTAGVAGRTGFVQPMLPIVVDEPCIPAARGADPILHRPDFDILLR